ncbi:hypothetical protein NDU88_001895 [Pleurodeles waltl]|uniref:Uncharacterized protein n=1 Tax=Pleurodeles waltl TaxID=8319 RepID=A0AAV7NKG7_PLEWA|nr:hypothetical protein NDU88_001895 [Pleurodeles waltl]
MEPKTSLETYVDVVSTEDTLLCTYLRKLAEQEHNMKSAITAMCPMQQETYTQPQELRGAVASLQRKAEDAEERFRLTNISFFGFSERLGGLKMDLFLKQWVMITVLADYTTEVQQRQNSYTTTAFMGPEIRSSLPAKLPVGENDSTLVFQTSVVAWSWLQTKGIAKPSWEDKERGERLTRDLNT